MSRPCEVISVHLTQCKGWFPKWSSWQEVQSALKNQHFQFILDVQWPLSRGLGGIPVALSGLINIRSRVCIGARSDLALSAAKPQPAPICSTLQWWCVFAQALCLHTILVLSTISLWTCVHSVRASRSHSGLSLSPFSSLSLSPSLSPHTQCLSFLFLSVGTSGCVYSFETVPKHQAQAKINYDSWRHSWNISHPDNPWPDNVQFIEANVSNAANYIHNCRVDAVSMISE